MHSKTLFIRVELVTEIQNHPDWDSHSHETESQNAESLCSCSHRVPLFQAPPLSLCFVILSINFHPTKLSVSQRMVISLTSQPHSKWKEKWGRSKERRRRKRKQRRSTQEEEALSRSCVVKLAPEPQSNSPSVSLPRTLSHALLLSARRLGRGFYLGTLSV